MRFPVRRVVAALLLLIPPVVLPLPATGRGRDRGASAGVVLHLEISAQSLGGAKRRVQVYLPAAYSSSDSSSRACPVVYLLHGWPGSEGNWFGLGHGAASADSLIASHAIPEVILVSP